MAKALSVDHFVQRLKEAGQTESVGEFTVNPQKAREKLREYQLLSPGSYVLKVVQAAVSAGALDIDVKATRDELTLSFGDSGLALPSADELLKNLTEGLEQPAKRSSLHHLTAAVNGAYAQDVREIRWETPGCALQITGSEFTELKRTGKSYNFVVRKKRSLKQWFMGTVYANEVRHLETRCLFGPQSISIDKRKLERPQWDRFGQPYRDDLGLDMPAFVLEAWQSAGSEVHLVAPPEHNYPKLGKDEGPQTLERGAEMRVWNHLTKSQNSQGKKPLPLLFQGIPNFQGAPSGGVSLAMAVRPSFQQPSVLLVVCDGVLLDSIEGEDLGHPGIVVITGMIDLNTDLSEFGVVKDKGFENRLAEIRKFVRESTEMITESQLRIAFGLLAEPTTLGRVYDWLQAHQLPRATSVEDLIWRHFPSSLLDRTPTIPEEQLQGAQMTYKGLLRDEPILALYDDGLIGKSEVGFIITEKKICWKNTMNRAEYYLWQELEALEEEAREQDQKLVENSIPTILKPQLKQHLLSFLVEVRKLGLEIPRDFEPKQWELCQRALTHLGKSEGIFYHPYIPNDKLKEALKNFPELKKAKDLAIVLYDDTLFGTADNGFLVTESTLYWRNIFSKSIAVKWADLDPANIEIDGSELLIEGEPLSIFREDLREPTLSFIQEMSG